MGTQFWWFFDAVLLSVTVGFIYSAAVNGFNKGVFHLVGFLAAIVLGFSGSWLLKNSVYEHLFREPNTEAIDSVLRDPNWDVFEEASELMALSAVDEEDAPDIEAFEALYQEYCAAKNHESGQDDGFEYPDWFLRSVCDVTEAAISAHQKPHSAERMSVLYDFSHDYAGFEKLVEAMRSEDTHVASVMLEEKLYRPNYVHMIHMAVFLLIESVILIIFGVISAMAGSLEAQMHLKMGNHALGALVGVVEAAGIILIMIAAVQLIITVSDSQMLVFNPQTIEQTKLFKYIYNFISW